MYTKQAKVRRKAKLERLALINLDGDAFEFDFDLDLDLN